MKRCCQLKKAKPGEPDLLRLLLLILATSWTPFPARQYIRTRHDDTSLRIAVSLRLCATMCAPQCGVQVDSSGVHGLAFRKSAGRHTRHNAVNDLIKRTLASANVPSVLEPNSLSRDDGKRLDGFDSVALG